jgi:hypothetical protein
MANTYGTKTNVEVKATIQAVLDKIMVDFSNSLSRCHEAAEFLMSGSERQYNGAKKLELRPGGSDLRGCTKGRKQADPRLDSIGMGGEGLPGM